MRCDEVRDLAPELALGIVNGEERAEALRHLTGCADCRRAVEELSEVADDLLMVAPVQEPSAGFETRVVAAMGLGEGSSRRKRARWRSPRWLTLRIGPVVATAAVTAAAMVGVYHNDHETAQRYRDTLAEANGSSFQAQRLTDEAGGRAGVAFGYQGSPSWLLLTVDPSHRDSVGRAELTTRNGRTIVLRSLRLDSQGSWGGAIPVKLYDVASVRLLGPHSGDTLRATFPQGPRERD